MKLQDHISQLPKHSVELDLWSTIEQQLPQGQHLAARLPRHKANPLLWDTLEAQLDKQAAKRRRFIPFSTWSIAASVAIILTMGIVFYTQQSSTHIYYSEEIVMETSQVNQWQVEDVNVMSNCQDQPAVCSTPNFTRLKSNLDQLKREEQKLRDLLQKTNDSKIELYHSRLVKDIQQVEAQILQLFS